MDTNKKILIFAPEQGTLCHISGELENRGYRVEWLPAESWRPDIFENAKLVVLDLVDWAFENCECVQMLRAHLVDRQDRLFPVVVLVRPDNFESCTCGRNLFKMLLHQNNTFLDMDDLAAIGENVSNLIDLLFELTSSSNREDWKRAERVLLRLAVHGIRIPGCDEALQKLEQHDKELGHKPRVRFVENNLVGCGTI
jgi:hypothetical protein